MTQHLYSVIPAKNIPASPQTTFQHPRKQHSVIPANNIPSFPRRRESTNPAHAGMAVIDNNSSTGRFHKSRARGNDGAFFSGIGVVEQWIPAFAGVTDGMDSRLYGNDAGFPERVRTSVKPAVD